MQQPTADSVDTAADRWLAAIDTGGGYLSAQSLDFSDTVTVLHIIGVGTDVVADADDFATAFMT
jgi:hypothetical protein